MPKVYPFDKEYVINTTLEHMTRSIDISIQKTLERIPEYENDSKVSFDILETLAKLNSFRNSIQQYKLNTAANFNF